MSGFFKTDLNRVKRSIGELHKRQAERGFWRPKEGTSIVRLLPPWSKDGAFSKEITTHYGIADHGVPCLKPWNDECPACALVDELRATNDRRDKEDARRMRASTRYISNVIVLKSATGEGDSGRGQIFAYGETIFGQIAEIIADPDWGDVSDPKTGRCLAIVRKGSGQFDTEYQVIPRPKPYPLKPEAVKLIRDLDKFVEELRMTPDQVRALIEGKDPGEAEEPDAEAEVEPDVDAVADPVEGEVEAEAEGSASGEDDPAEAEAEPEPESGDGAIEEESDEDPVTEPTPKPKPKQVAPPAARLKQTPAPEAKRPSAQERIAAIRARHTKGAGK